MRDDGDGGGRGLIVQVLEGGAKEVGEDGDGDGAGASLLVAVAADEADEGLAGVWDKGEGDGELLELVGVGAVLEGVEVALGSTGAGSGAAAPGLADSGLVVHCEGMIERAFCTWKGDVSGE